MWKRFLWWYDTAWNYVIIYSCHCIQGKEVGCYKIIYKDSCTEETTVSQEGASWSKTEKLKRMNANTLDILLKQLSFIFRGFEDFYWKNGKVITCYDIILGFVTGPSKTRHSSSLSWNRLAAFMSSSWFPG